MLPGVKLVVLGKQGAGKGTQCVRLSHHYVVPHISTGDMLRGEVKSTTPFGVKVRAIIDAGELISDELVMEMVTRRIAEPDARTRGFLLDGCPRTTAQASALEAALDPDCLDVVVNLDVPTEMVLTRLAARRVCVDCGTNYSVSTPPMVDWSCDVCGGEVIQRPDDTEEAISRRLDVYEAQTAPLISWYKARELLCVVDGTGSPEEVTRRCVVEIDTRRAAKRG